MNVNDYQKQAEVTENKDLATIGERFTRPDNIRLIHATLGLISELGEFAGQLKKHLIYGTPLDKINLSEESGDLLWYLALAANVPGMKSLDEDMQLNIAKLRKRFGGKFSEFDAINRDTKAERTILENQYCNCNTRSAEGSVVWTDASQCPVHKEQAESANRRY